jgi:hypothetical protein
MNKRLAAGLLASGMTATVFGVVSAQPASATPTPCGTYPPGQSYQLTRTPTHAEVAVGSIVGTRGTMRRGGQACVGFEMGFYVKVASRPFYGLRSHGPSDTTGSFRASWTADETFRFRYSVKLSPNAIVRSAISEVIAR